jgi:hypothetical protein
MDPHRHGGPERPEVRHRAGKDFEAAQRQLRADERSSGRRK